MKVRSEENPNTELIRQSLEKVDFNDVFSTTNQQDDLNVIAHKIFDTQPKWVAFLFRVRNFLVKIIGLKTTQPEDYHTQYEVGGYIGFFKLFAITPNELIMGLDDSHLNFRVSIYNSQDPTFNIKVTTLVQYVNRTGKIYLFFVKPFHRIIVRKMVKQAYLK